MKTSTAAMFLFALSMTTATGPATSRVYALPTAPGDVVWDIVDDDVSTAGQAREQAKEPLELLASVDPVVVFFDYIIGAIGRPASDDDGDLDLYVINSPGSDFLLSASYAAFISSDSTSLHQLGSQALLGEAGPWMLRAANAAHASLGK